MQEKMQYLVLVSNANCERDQSLQERQLGTPTKRQMPSLPLQLFAPKRLKERNLKPRNRNASWTPVNPNLPRALRFEDPNEYGLVNGVAIYDKQEVNNINSRTRIEEPPEDFSKFQPCKNSSFVIDDEDALMNTEGSYNTSSNLSYVETSCPNLQLRKLPSKINLISTSSFQSQESPEFGSIQIQSSSNNVSFESKSRTNLPLVKSATNAISLKRCQEFVYPPCNRCIEFSNGSISPIPKLCKDNRQLSPNPYIGEDCATSRFVKRAVEEVCSVGTRDSRANNSEKRNLDEIQNADTEILNVPTTQILVNARDIKEFCDSCSHRFDSGFNQVHPREMKTTELIVQELGSRKTGLSFSLDYLINKYTSRCKPIWDGQNSWSQERYEPVGESITKERSYNQIISSPSESKSNPTMSEILTIPRILNRDGLLQYAISASSFVTGEKISPNLKPSIPGSRSQDVLKKELSSIQQTDDIKFFLDYDRSLENNKVDGDSHMLLGNYTEISSIPLDYSHPELIDALKDPYLRTLVNSPPLSVCPSKNFTDDLETSVLSDAQKNLRKIRTTSCGSCLYENIENALKTIFLRYRKLDRVGATFTIEENGSFMINQLPWAHSLSILSFHGASQNRAISDRSCIHSKPIHKVHIPVYDWPIARFPVYKYPFEENVRENHREEKRCLSQVADLIEQWSKKGNPVAGIIIEPIQAEGGDHHVSPEFYLQLQQLSKERDIALLVNEVQTGSEPCMTMWCDIQLNFPSRSDVVVCDKMLTDEFFYTPELKLDQPSYIFNNWMDELNKLETLRKVLEILTYDNVLKNIQLTGDILLNGLKDFQKRYPHILNSARGRGIFTAVDAADTVLRDKVMVKLKEKGVHATYCGEKAIHLQPSLFFESKHANLLLDKLQSILKEL